MDQRPFGDSCARKMSEVQVILDTRLTIAVAAFTFAALVPQPMVAQAKHRHGTQQSSVAKYSGQIEKIQQEQCAVCKCIELSVTLKTGDGTLLVRLGPKQYFDERDFVLSKGDLIELTGVTFKEKGQTIVLATEVRKGGDTVMLRGKYGKPRWLQEHGHTCAQCGN
jgi:hypothetical protein